MRLFIAIQLDEEVKQALLSVQDAFRAQGVRGNYTPEENLHLTLAFIGEYPDPAEILEIMEEIEFEPIRLEFGGIGSFHNLWWAGIQENEALHVLVKRLRRALSDVGIPYDRKKFRPHITLIRRPVTRGPHGSAPAELSDLELPAASVSMTADRVSLMLSTRGKHGMIYTELGAATAESSAAEQQEASVSDSAAHES